MGEFVSECLWARGSRQHDLEFPSKMSLLKLKTLMVRHGGSSAGSYLANPTSPLPSHCAVIILIKSCPSASIVVTST